MSFVSFWPDKILINSRWAQISLEFNQSLFDYSQINMCSVWQCSNVWLFPTNTTSWGQKKPSIFCMGDLFEGVLMLKFHSSAKAPWAAERCAGILFNVRRYCLTPEMFSPKMYGFNSSRTEFWYDRCKRSRHPLQTITSKPKTFVWQLL